MKMSTQEIINYLSVNQDAWKKTVLKNIEDVSAVNELLTENDLNTIMHNSEFYDDLFDSYKPFDEILDDYFMLHLDIEQNSNDVMIWLQRIYS
ncbi:hypothetical protein BJD49_gp039 [Acinetobacter phage vB_AbaM_phiAbaA1]|uniref:hypothetical protein n=1 Tax=Acinetobacter phage vB_AbaM_phiAbaA1 TaxID=1605379 RepID=UPI00078D8ABE|nr:hypothetical protein BJD49_gp039 [Acinetobacter phage vB_AbaM_phiAbaA1]AJK27251.1 hypothetical protein phiAbaA1_148 [Acinetobacter phage vB_AbaM_phiAbaA1]AZF88545.1 hypothetical protein TAC_0157 [Acinetobacter phage TAC1]